MWMEGFTAPEVHEHAASLGEDAAVYYFISALLHDIGKLSPEKKLSPKSPLDLFNATGVLGEIPIHAIGHIDAVVTGLIPTLEKCIADGTITIATSVDVLVETLLAGLTQGFLNDHAQSEEYPWFEGQRRIAAALQSYLATTK